MHHPVARYTPGWGGNNKQTQQYEEKATLYKATFKTNTKLPISFYTKGKIVKNVYMQDGNTKKNTYIIMETTQPTSYTEMHTFLQETKGCNVLEIHPLYNTAILYKENTEMRLEKISEICKRRKKYDLTVEAGNSKQKKEPEDSNTHLYTEMARQVDNHRTNSLQKTENIKNTIEYIQRENKDERSPMMMCLALERFIMQYNTNLQPCYERNLCMIKQNIKEGIWTPMTYDETMEKLEKTTKITKKKETNDTTTNQQKIERSRSI